MKASQSSPPIALQSSDPPPPPTPPPTPLPPPSAAPSLPSHQQDFPPVPPTPPPPPHNHPAYRGGELGAGTVNVALVIDNWHLAIFTKHSRGLKQKKGGGFTGWEGVGVRVGVGAEQPPAQKFRNYTVSKLSSRGEDLSRFQGFIGSRFPRFY